MLPARAKSNATPALPDKFDHLNNFRRKLALLLKLRQRKVQILWSSKEHCKSPAERLNRSSAESRAAQTNRVNRAQGVSSIHQAKWRDIPAGAA